MHCADCAYADCVPEPLTKAEADKIIAEGEARYAAVLEWRIKQLEAHEAVCSDPEALWSNWLRGTVKLQLDIQLAAEDRIQQLEEAIRKTLDENRHLADGEDCTLRELKKALPTWN